MWGGRGSYTIIPEIFLSLLNFNIYSIISLSMADSGKLIPQCPIPMESHAWVFSLTYNLDSGLFPTII